MISNLLLPIRQDVLRRVFPSKLLYQPFLSRSFSEKITESTSEETIKVEKNPGQYFHDLMYRGRKGRLLALGDLRKLMQQCVSKSHVSYAVEGVKLFQRKGQDFSEEVNSHFINACIRGQKPQAAAELFVKWENRIGAWCTYTSASKLVEALDETKDAALLKELHTVLSAKGVPFSESAMAKITRVEQFLAGSDPSCSDDAVNVDGETSPAKI